jgi:hypothetical protein
MKATMGHQTVKVNGANPSLRRDTAKQGVFSLFRIAREKLCPTACAHGASCARYSVCPVCPTTLNSSLPVCPAVPKPKYLGGFLFNRWPRDARGQAAPLHRKKPAGRRRGRREPTVWATIAVDPSESGAHSTQGWQGGAIIHGVGRRGDIQAFHERHRRDRNARGGQGQQNARVEYVFGRRVWLVP